MSTLIVEYSVEVKIIYEYQVEMYCFAWQNSVLLLLLFLQ